MSTRSNIKITDSKNTFYLYRHWDGYPAETGADVHEIAASLTKGYTMDWESPAIKAVNRFMKKLTVDFQSAPRLQYELTEQPHGDIEQFYHIIIDDIEIPGNNPDYKKYMQHIVIGYCNGYGPELEDNTVTYTLDQFKDIVNKDRKQINARIKYLQEEQPAAYADAELYPLIA